MWHKAGMEASIKAGTKLAKVVSGSANHSLVTCATALHGRVRHLCREHKKKRSQAKMTFEASLVN